MSGGGGPDIHVNMRRAQKSEVQQKINNLQPQIYLLFHAAFLERVPASRENVTEASTSGTQRKSGMFYAPNAPKRSSLIS